MFKPKFEITTSILNNLNRIEVIKDNIRTCKIHPQEEFSLKRQAILSMVHHSTAIEGNTLNEFEVQKVLDGKHVRAPQGDIYEVKNYKKALDFIARKKPDHITVQDILKIHGLATRNVLPLEKSGCFRKESVFVVRRRLGYQEILYTGPHYKKVEKLTTELCDFLNTAHDQEISPILLAGIAHSEIAAIHPFADGNGRTARLLATMILYTGNYDFRKLFALENYYNTNRPAYYKAINLGKTYEARSKSSMTSWLEYFVQGFLVEMEQVLEKIKPFMFLNDINRKRIIISRKEMQILDFLQEMNSLKSSDVVDILTVTKRTAQRLLTGLINKGVLIKKGGKKDASYVIKGE